VLEIESRTDHEINNSSKLPTIESNPNALCEVHHMARRKPPEKKQLSPAEARILRAAEELVAAIKDAYGESGQEEDQDGLECWPDPTSSTGYRDQQGRPRPRPGGR
jgi:hypothetical protein